jgi:hypothetical protein
MLRAGDCATRPRYPTALPDSALVIRRGIGGQSSRQEGVVAGEEVRPLGLRQGAALECPSLVGGRLHLAQQSLQQSFQLGGPSLLILLLQEGQLT